MTELDEFWSRMLSDAAANASAQGRHDVAEYLSLKAANDTLRAAGVKWLLESTIEIAAEMNRTNLSISIERREPFSFLYHGANLVGSQLRMLLGVRCLTLEAGWTRTPSDGFIRGGSLAIARFKHLGISRSNSELALVKGDTGPIWTDSSSSDSLRKVTINDLRRHLTLLLGN